MKPLNSICALALIAGSTLIPLLPIGVALGTGSFWFAAAFAAHLVAALAALAVSLQTLVSITKGSLLARIIAIGCAAVVSIESLVPVTARDALIHHLAVPKWWLASGYIHPIPWHEWSYYPMLVNLGYTGLMAAGVERLLPLYHAMFLVILAAALAAFLIEETASRKTACLGALVCISLPLSLRLASVPLVDLGLALYSALPFFLLAAWRKAPSDRPLVLAGISLGLALGCKYNAILSNSLTVACVLLLADGKKITLGRAVRAASIVGTLGLVVASPWLVKNFAWTGNPVYPLYRSLFGGAGPESGITPRGLPALTYRMWRYGETPLDLALVPLRMILFGRDNDPRYFDGVLGPIVLLSVAGAWRLRGDRWTRACVLYSFAYLGLALLSSSARTRYLVPVAGPVLALTAIGGSVIVELAAERWRRWILLGIEIYAGLAAALYSTGLLLVSRPFDFVRSGFDERAYLGRRIPELGMIETLNSLRPEGVTYLLFTGNRFYYYDVPVMSGGHFSEGLLRRWIQESETSEALAARLASNGVTHILEHAPARQSFVESLSDDERRRWELLFTGVREIATSGPYRLLAIAG